MKNILHFQIPIGKNEQIRDNLLIRPETIGKFMKLIKDTLGDEYYVIVSPFVPTMINSENLFNFDASPLNIEQLVALLEERKLTDQI